ncbi:MAG: tRNA preQ1(34) S-adenosylmethionine ribosyltransferase-isomerase QueA [Halanaerobiales bacterium]|nr:tRNA preQ1(34) S-adenosylmethionine ribosyltransferase-isomerase QueA [Halanaerobiales bacterium]
MKVEEFDYYLPEELIAQRPIKNRDESRLLVLQRETGNIEHLQFKDLVDYLNPGDLLVLNNSRVIPARLYGEKMPNRTKVEVLLINEKREGCWEVLVKPGKRVKKGVTISFGDGKLKGMVVGDTEFGGRVIEFNYQGDFTTLLEQLGELPVPPYINEKLAEPERYQTVYAEKKGSIAAPTAGLHFTPRLLNRIEEAGVNLTYLTLHVGLGTFKPVKTVEVEEHQMHSEYYELDEKSARQIIQTREKGKRVIAVGTTVTRTLEGVVAKYNRIKAGRGFTDLFIYPGYHLKAIDGLITNFHLPKSTLLMLVSALAGRENILNAYRQAVQERYRFFSLGDAMLII